MSSTHTTHWYRHPATLVITELILLAVYLNGVQQGLTMTCESCVPVISLPTVTFVTPTTALVTWQTDLPTDGQVVYGTTDAYGMATPNDTTLATDHAQLLTNLLPDTQYFYQVKSAAGGVAALSQADVFKTATRCTTAPQGIGQKNQMSVIRMQPLTDCSSLSPGTAYLFYTPDTLSPVAFDDAIRRATDGKTAAYMLYRYSDASATYERQNAGKFLDQFAASPDAWNDPALAARLTAFEAAMGIQFHPTDGTTPAGTLESNQLYVLVPLETDEAWLSTTDPLSFRDLGSYSDVSDIYGQLVGPGPIPGSQRFYASYSYYGSAPEIVGIDPDTGDYDVFPIPSTSTIRAMIVGSDHNVYVGTEDNATIYRIDPVQKSVSFVGRPSSTESYIWQFATGSDHKIYGCTYPSAKLVRYDPATNVLEDLGRMDPHEMYARFIGASADGFIYTSIMTVHQNIAAYEIATGEKREILPAEYAGWNVSAVKQALDGKVYAQINNGTSAKWLRLEGWDAVPDTLANFAGFTADNILDDGRQIMSVRGGKITVKNPSTGQTVSHPYSYPGKGMNFFRIGSGPDGKIYGSTVLPLYLVRKHPALRGMERIDSAEQPLGSGETYSLLAYGSNLYLASYGATPLMVYDPALPYHPGTGPNDNPYRVPSLPAITSTWRPVAMIAAGNSIYIGSIPGYGLLGGYLTEVDPATRSMKGAYAVVPNQSVFSLTSWNGLIVGGTSIGGGGGAVPTDKDAHLFLWDPVTKQTVFDTIPVTGAASINDLLTLPNGKIIGFAGSSFFVFDPEQRMIVKTGSSPFAGTPLNNSIALGPNNLVYGLFSGGIFTIDVSTYDLRVAATYKPGITSGFALSGNHLYFTAQSHIIQYTIPSGSGN